MGNIDFIKSLVNDSSILFKGFSSSGFIFPKSYPYDYNYLVPVPNVGLVPITGPTTDKDIFYDIATFTGFTLGLLGDNVFNETLFGNGDGNSFINWQYFLSIYTGNPFNAGNGANAGLLYSMSVCL